jgi:hypothetical protein
MAQQIYRAYQQATVNAHVTLNGQPAAGVKVVANFAFGTGGTACQALTDASGNASCSVSVPPGNAGQTVAVDVEAIAQGYSVQTTTYFRVGS